MIEETFEKFRNLSKTFQAIIMVELCLYLLFISNLRKHIFFVNTVKYSQTMRKFECSQTNRIFKNMVWDVDLRHKWNRKSGRAHWECLPPVPFQALLEKWGKATSRHCATFLWSYEHISKQLNKIYFFIDSYTLLYKISLQSMTYTPIPGQCPHQQWIRGANCLKKFIFNFFIDSYTLLY